MMNTDKLASVTMGEIFNEAEHAEIEAAMEAANEAAIAEFCAAVRDPMPEDF
jgi:hypothetical protein